MDKLFTTTSFLKYRFRAGTLHDVHSPFVYDLLDTVIHDQTPFYAYEKIESLRARMLLDQRSIEVKDYGTGHGKLSSSRRVSYIASHHVKPKKFGQLLFRLVNRFHSRTILELGTSLGVTSLYLAAPDSTNFVVTMEGCPQTAAIAAENFKLMNAGNIQLVVGEFGQTLPAVVDQFNQLDFVYFDGNHSFQPTMEYFSLCLKKHHQDSVFVFDDIYRSRDMTSAWQAIQRNPAVGLTIDLFHFGLVFFQQNMPRQHFILRF